MWHAALTASSGASAAEWLADRITGATGTVTGTVPAGYDAYARILHPSDYDGRWVTWADVAKATGRQPHAVMQWHAVVGSPDPLNTTGSLWAGGDPWRGRVPPETLAPLCELLVAHTKNPQHCFFCLWAGWAEVSGHSGRMVGPADDAPPESADLVVFPELSDRDLTAPRIHLPGRDYLLFKGSLAALASSLDLIVRTGSWPRDELLPTRSPNLFWSPDRAWCVASEIDFDSTLVGGSVALIDAILNQPALDAWAVGPDDWLTADADRFNVVSSE